MFLRVFCVAAFFAATSLVLAATSTPAVNSVVGYSVRSDIDRKLYRIEMTTGVATEIGATGFGKIEALAVNAAGEIFGVNPATSQLVKCSSTTGACAAVGVLTGVLQVQTNAGLAFASSGVLYLAMNAVIYRVDPATGATVALGATGPALSGLAAVNASPACASGLYGIGGNSDRGKFYCINVTNGSAALLGTLTVSPLDSGLDGDITTGLVWGITNNTPGQVFAVDPATLALSNLNTVSLAGSEIGGFESLAVLRSTVTTIVPAEDPVNGNAQPVPTLSAALLVLLSLVMAAAAFFGAAGTTGTIGNARRGSSRSK